MDLAVAAVQSFNGCFRPIADGRSHASFAERGIANGWMLRSRPAGNPTRVLFKPFRPIPQRLWCRPPICRRRFPETHLFNNPHTACSLPREGVPCRARMCGAMFSMRAANRGWRFLTQICIVAQVRTCQRTRGAPARDHSCRR